MASYYVGSIKIKLVLNKGKSHGKRGRNGSLMITEEETGFMQISLVG